jgi:chromatin remodeling complex protein RSC6
MSSAKKTIASKSKSKSKATVVDTPITIETVTVAATVAAPTKAKSAKTKASKSTKTKTTKTTKETAPAATIATIAAEKVDNVIVNAEVADTWEPSLGDEFAVVLNTLSGLRTQIQLLQTNLRALQKRADKDVRVAAKSAKKKRSNGAPRAPSGFVKPTLITDELATFLGKDSGTEMARTQVTREINMYIREHNLQDPSNGRRIIPDACLRKLLRVPESEELTYFNLQRYMSPHFVKKDAIAAAEAIASA